MRLFIDTSAFYAVYDPADTFHDNAIECVKKLQQQEVELFTSNYVVLETISLLQRRLGIEAAKSFAAQMDDYFHVAWVDSETYKKISVLWKKINNKNISFVDCSCFVLMKELGISKVFSFDAHFSKYGHETI